MNGRLLRGLLVLLVLLLCGHSAGAGEKSFGGVGLQVVATARGDLVVLQVVEGSPAARAGLQPGDLIVQVDDFSLAGSDFAEVVSRYLWGEAGTSVTLRFLRPGQVGTHTVTLHREKLKPELAPTPGVRMLAPSGN